MQAAPNPSSSSTNSPTHTVSEKLDNDPTRSTLPLSSQGQKSWRDSGCPELTRWKASSNDFFVIRKFEQLDARVVLSLQDELAVLEGTIEEMDFHGFKHVNDGIENSKWGSGSFRIDRRKNCVRHRAVMDAAAKLKEYYEFLALFSEIKSKPSAQDFQVQNVKNHLENICDSIHPNEADYIQCKGDLVTLVPKTKTLFRLWFEKSARLRNWFRLRDDPDRKDRVHSEFIHYSSDRWFEYGISALVVGGGLAMLLGPMWCLDLMDSSVSQLGIITGFVVLFVVLLFCSNANVSRAFEVLAASAAYAAVLAVFLQVNEPS